jgi:type IV pilus assembly protein PilY1
VTQSGVMNYLNKFGEYGAGQYLAGNSSYASNKNIYMTYDHVSELYYAALRYYENLGNVPQWLPQSAYGASSVQLDGFPAVTTWTDPIAYSCQSNFILGIGDDHTWTDYNVGGSSADGLEYRRPFTRAAAGLSGHVEPGEHLVVLVQSLEGMTQTAWWPFDSGATYYIAGLAYGAHVIDIRPDLTGTQTISTYWMDVAEDQEVENLNPYYLATKYGGFTVPPGYLITNTTPLTLGEYDTGASNILMNGNNTHPLPNNYFETGNASQMVSSLTSAFTNIANAIKAYTTSFSLSSPNVSSSGETSFASQYDSTSWTSVITASTLQLVGGVPTVSTIWVSSTTLQSQLAGTGWQNARSVATWNGSTGVPFEYTNLTAAQKSALAPSYSSSTTATQYLNYLRGDRTNEVGSTASGSTQSLRARTLLLGDMVDASLTPVSAPIMSFSEANNPGYTAFRSTWAARPTMVYAGANDGMLHAFVGSTGVERFAYVPSALFQGPTGTPQVNGLAQLGNPQYTHHYYVDATPVAFDMDLNHTNGNTTGSPNWHTLLIGGLGKGGKSYYALDVTNPASMSTEAAVAANVVWEFTDSTMGYSYGAPLAVKTLKYGWVVALTSGYNNSDGYGYLYLVNPANGTLLEKIRTPTLSSGLTQVSGFAQDYTDYTVDSFYVGDLNGQLWRFDVTGTTGSYPQPTQIASLTDSLGNPQPVTTAPDIEVHPTTRLRYVMLGTGRLLSSADVSSTAMQTFYAIEDGTTAAFKTWSTPVTRSTLTQVTNVTQGVTVPATSNGWYYDLGTGWRVVINPTDYNGNVAFAALATTTNPCSPTGSSEVYVLNYATGTSVLSPTLANSTIPAAYFTTTTGVIKLEFVTSNNSSSGVEVIAGTTAGPPQKVPANLTGAISTRLLNWLEVPTAE